MKTLDEMLVRMYALAVWDHAGRQYLPVFDYAWKDVAAYMPAEDAIRTNCDAWQQDKGVGQ